MFAVRDQSSTTKSAESKSERTTAPGAKESPEPNPIWQSLALGSAAIQTKLAISQPGDPYEQEADRIADRVMRKPAPLISASPSARRRLSFSPAGSLELQRKCDPCEEDEKLRRGEPAGNHDAPAPAPPVVHQALNSSSQPIDPATRRFMESSLGQDFKQVRVHTNALAAEAASAIGARAYTVNRDIVFGSGQYAPQSKSGRQLLSHELTHVIQQRGVVGRVQRQSTKDKRAKGATATVPKSVYHWEPGGAPKVPAQPLTTVTTYGTTVPTAKLKLVDVYVETFTELADAALRPDTKAVHIVGSGLEYFKNHETTQQIRRDFFIMLEEMVRSQQAGAGKLTDTFGAGLRSYGRIWTSPVSKGTWMIGKTDQPTINYEVTYSRLTKDQWEVDWKAKWKIVDDFDFRPGKDKSWVYNAFAIPFGTMWHDVAGGKEDLPVHLEWEESGSFLIQPTLPPTVTTYGTTITSPRAVNVGGSGNASFAK